MLEYLESDVSVEPLPEVELTISGDEDTNRKEHPKCQPHEPPVGFEPLNGARVALVGIHRTSHRRRRHRLRNHTNTRT